MKWTVHGERSVYASDRLQVNLADVELPDGRRFEHHLIRLPAAAAGVVIAEREPEPRVLLLWRHRFITDTWGWEVPAGRIEPGETAVEGAAREALEETGWQPGPLRPLCRFFPSNGLSDQAFHVFVADGATYVGPPVDWYESQRVEWLTVAEVRRHLQSGDICDGLAMTALCYWLAVGLA